MSQEPGSAGGRSANIFVNYRREDSAGHAGRLFDRLGSRFPGRVFMDIDNLEPGIDFVEAIEQAVGCCEVLIVMIGREWLNVTDAAGRRRLDDPRDFVRLEVATALARNIRVIPVLVQDAPMPRPEELPPDLAKLARRNAIELSDARWAFDVDRLARTIEEVLAERGQAAAAPSSPSAERREPALPTPVPAPAGGATRRRAWLALPAVLLLAAAGWLVVKSLKPHEVPPEVVEAQPLESGEDGTSPVEAGGGSPIVPPEEADAPPPPEPVAEPDACQTGFVWREAGPADHVCVTPETRQQAADDNAQAEARRDPAGGPYGPDTCLSGYVWRDAFADDHVCVTPETRTQAASDNARADERRMPR